MSTLISSAQGVRRLFCGYFPTRSGNARVDLLEQFVVDQGDVVSQGLVTEDFGVFTPGREENVILARCTKIQRGQSHPRFVLPQQPRIASRTGKVR